MEVAAEDCEVAFAGDEDSVVGLVLDVDVLYWVPLGPAVGGGERTETRREEIFDRHTGQVLAV